MAREQACGVCLCDWLAKSDVLNVFPFGNLISTWQMQKFDKTLSDDLNPEPMKCTPMSIAL